MNSGKPFGLPEIESGGYLIECFFDVGPTQWSGDNEIRITWQELDAYSRSTKRLSEPWEFDVIIKMSQSYLEAKHEGKDPMCVAPSSRESFLND